MRENRIMPSEAAQIMGVNPNFIYASIRNGSMPGCWSENKYKDAFFIPRKAFYKFLGWDNSDIEEYENTKKDAATAESSASQEV